MNNLLKYAIAGFATGFLIVAITLNLRLDAKTQIILNRMDTLVTVVHDTVRVVETVHDTIRETKYVTSTVYSNAVPSRLDTFEVHQGSTSLNIEFTDSFMEFGDVKEYKILCNGSLYDKPLEDGDTITECNGEWLIRIKGER